MSGGRHHRSPSVRLDFTSATGARHPKLFSNPSTVEAAYRLDDVEAVFSRVDAHLAEGRLAAGFVAYEAAAAFDTALETQTPLTDLPLVWFGIFDAKAAGTALVDAGEVHQGGNGDGVGGAGVDWSTDIGEEAFNAAVTTIRDAIERGETYQVNFTFRLTATIDPSSAGRLYRRLLDVHRPRYAAHVDLGSTQILSLSPELFFRIDNAILTSQPMKGTAARGLWEADDRVASARLRQSGKDRSENVMIVDLVRNDISRLAQPGTVRASSLFDLERFPAVWQMTSTVEGRLGPDVRSIDLFRALFPAGSITGAPKTSAMRTIRALERTPRGVYTGAIGYLCPTGDAAFNVAIRTATIDANGRATAGVGGGITWESRPADEFAEAMNKASFLEVPPGFDLFETMRLEAGTIVRRARHLARLAASAEFLDFRFDPAVVERALSEAAEACPTGTFRLKLILSRAGGVTAEVSPMEPEVSGCRSFVLAKRPVPSRDRRLYHKTSDRSLYQQARAENENAFDVLLWNERGDVTEFTIGNLVAEINGRRYTPPISCGLLPGVFRGDLLDAGAIAERVLSHEDVGRATRLWLINSLRGWVEVAERDT